MKQIKELNEEKRRSARRKEFIMAELLETERSYVKVRPFFNPKSQSWLNVKTVNLEKNQVF